MDEAAGKKKDRALLLKVLANLGNEYSNLLRASAKLQKLALSQQNDAFDKLKQTLINNRITELVPINEAICDVSITLSTCL